MKRYGLTEPKRSDETVRMDDEIDQGMMDTDAANMMQEDAATHVRQESSILKGSSALRGTSVKSRQLTRSVYAPQKMRNNNQMMRSDPVDITHTAVNTNGNNNNNSNHNNIPSTNNASDDSDSSHNVQNNIVTATLPDRTVPMIFTHTPVKNSHRPATAVTPGSTRVSRRVKAKDGTAGCILINGMNYHVLDILGEGGFSKVYKVLSDGREIFALKEIRLAPETPASSYISEIELLTQLKDESNVIKLHDYSIEETHIYMVFEIGTADQSKIQKQAQQSSKGGQDETQIRYFWREMQNCVEICHKHHIQHLDLKPANFVAVNGQQKLIDFGIAKQVEQDATSVMREDQIGTLNYMAPETIDKQSNDSNAAFKLNNASDIWSLGCILFQMIYGHTPFAQERSVIKKLAAICSPEIVKFPPFPDKLGGGEGDPQLLDVLSKCLEKNPKKRITLQKLRDHPYLHPSAAAKQYPDLRPIRSVSTGELSRAMTSAAKTQPQLQQVLLDMSDESKRAFAREVLKLLMR